MRDSRCHCLFRHALTEDETIHASAVLDDARKHGDLRMVAIALQQITGDCPAKRRLQAIKRRRNASEAVKLRKRYGI